MAYDTEEQTAGFLGGTGTFQCGFKFIRAPFCLLVNNKDMKKTISDETSEGGNGRERPDDLQKNGYSNRDAEQKHHHASSAFRILASECLREHNNRRQNKINYQKVAASEKTEYK